MQKQGTSDAGLHGRTQGTGVTQLDMQHVQGTWLGDVLGREPSPEEGS